VKTRHDALPCIRGGDKSGSKALGANLKTNIEYLFYVQRKEFLHVIRLCIH
jgi:hypothetical protein